MREIKFRAWSSISEGFIEPVLLDGVSGRLFGSKATVMLASGIVDKNGVEIYEGDIIRTSYDNPASNGTQVCEVIWDSSIPGLSDGYHDGLHSDSEVIGNIYENPELLEQK